ncbi:hypothetical protein RRG08_004815 [Elysia crispata]|uniref:Uncharacterized protein n=1 Tax=Elysia crispata TaxID=231223 RepID=A0AAE0Y537_9GAST|nr:hypothetical protein RRG08_004815 [Elysia crispata]
MRNTDEEKAGSKTHGGNYLTVWDECRCSIGLLGVPEVISGASLRQKGALYSSGCFKLATAMSASHMCKPCEASSRHPVNSGWIQQEAIGWLWQESLKTRRRGSSDLDTQSFPRSQVCYWSPPQPSSSSWFSP